jgi:hypothetical protein
MNNLECAGKTIRMARRTTFGPNYIVEAYLSGPIDARTGLLTNLIDIDHLLKAAIKDAKLNDSPESIAASLFQSLITKLPVQLPGVEIQLDKVRLHISEDLYLEYGT